MLSMIFLQKGRRSRSKNMEAITRGRQIMNELLVDRIGEWELAPADGKRRMFMIGNDAIALGAIAAGTRFMAAYPITPASEIMEYLIKNYRSSVALSSKRKMRLLQQQWLLALTLAVYVPLPLLLVLVFH